MNGNLGPCVRGTVDAEDPLQLLCSLAHVVESVAVLSSRWIKALAVVLHDEPQLSWQELQRYLYLGCPRVLEHVGQSLLGHAVQACGHRYRQGMLIPVSVQNGSHTSDPVELPYLVIHHADQALLPSQIRVSR